MSTLLNKNILKIARYLILSMRSVTSTNQPNAEFLNFTFQEYHKKGESNAKLVCPLLYHLCDYAV